MKKLISLYMYIVGVIMIIIIFLTQLLLRPFFKPQKTFPVISFLFRLTFKLLFIKLEIEYDTPITRGKSYIFMANHTSFWDVFVAGASFPVYVSALEAHTHFRWPIYGLIIKAYGQIPINRNNPRSSWNSYLKAIEKMHKEKISIIVFPEGTRSRDGKLQRFKKIPFKFAREAGVDLVPVGFVNVNSLSPMTNFWIQPTRIKVHFGTPIPKEEIAQMSVEDLQEKVYSEIKRLSEQ